MISFFDVGGIILVSSPLWLRAANEVGCRTIHRAITICPHCGFLDVIESERPEVFR